MIGYKRLVVRCQNQKLWYCRSLVSEPYFTITTIIYNFTAFIQTESSKLPLQQHSSSFMEHFTFLSQTIPICKVEVETEWAAFRRVQWWTGLLQRNWKYLLRIMNDFLWRTRDDKNYVMRFGDFTTAGAWHINRWWYSLLLSLFHFIQSRLSCFISYQQRVAAVIE